MFIGFLNLLILFLCVIFTYTGIADRNMVPLAFNSSPYEENFCAPRCCRCIFGLL